MCDATSGEVECIPGKVASCNSRRSRNSGRLHHCDLCISAFALRFSAYYAAIIIMIVIAIIATITVAIVAVIVVVAATIVEMTLMDFTAFALNRGMVIVVMLQRLWHYSMTLESKPIRSLNLNQVIGSAFQIPG